MSENPNLTIALAPLDERPVNTRYPQMLGAIAGASVLLPPEEIRGNGRDPADVEAVSAWLTDAARNADGVIASADYLAYGNLINARISDDSTTDVLPRLKPLETAARNGKPVYAFGLITRVSNANDSVEEPLYWSEYGTRFFRYSALLHKREAGALEGDDADTLARLSEELPQNFVADWLNRRLRNHTVNLALLDLLARDRLTFLLLTSDDTSPWGTPTREKAWLESWLSLLGSGVASRLLVHPGADEVCSALVARMVSANRDIPLTVCPDYALTEGANIIAPYEDRPVRQTVEGQIRACGCQLAESPEEADVILGVLPPSPVRTEFRESFAETERRDREKPYRAFFARLGQWQREGRLVALADVAYPNGADPLAIELLLASDSPLAPGKLAAYGAWNTAGNTLGTVVAQAVCSLSINGNSEREKAQHAFLAHRFLEDYGYQTVVRKEARDANRTRFHGRHDPDPSNPDEVAFTTQTIETALHRILTEELQPHGIGTTLELTPHSVRLPWNRTFEVDFTLR